jgi:hypothetical protein
MSSYMSSSACHCVRFRDGICVLLELIPVFFIYYYFLLLLFFFICMIYIHSWPFCTALDLITFILIIILKRTCFLRVHLLAAEQGRLCHGDGRGRPLCYQRRRQLKPPPWCKKRRSVSCSEWLAYCSKYILSKPVTLLPYIYISAELRIVLSTEQQLIKNSVRIFAGAPARQEKGNEWKMR